MAIIDIAIPPSGSLTPFNVYVALLRCRGCANIRLLWDFDERPLMSHPSEYLRIEDERLINSSWITTRKKWRDGFQATCTVLLHGSLTLYYHRYVHNPSSTDK